MAERNITEIIKDSSKLLQEITDYIRNTEHYIFYWIANREVKDYIQEYPTDFEDRIELIVDDIHKGTASVKIVFKSQTVQFC